MSGRPLPNPLPRPDGELEALERAWLTPRGWRIFGAVNNTVIGLFYVGTALLFLVLAGVLALLMRAQLAVPGNDLLSNAEYNRIFTMHGTVMMFLFAVPVVEAVAVLLLPNMLGARDLPFPRLSAYAYWAYAIGGLVFFGTIFFGVAPDGGWFMYPPLTGGTYSPGSGADWWLLGIGFIEISAIAGAVELVVGILRTRAPGMSLMKMPLFAWAMLVVGAMIVFGFPPIILGTLLLELERALGWPFFIVERGGDPVLWQHLFWLFGHPEVYIIFLPAAGMISMIVPTLARTRLAGYRWIVAATIIVGVLSFTLWAHHMYAIGLTHKYAAFFSAASMAVSIPTAIQLFSWVTTLWRGEVRFAAPTWFLLAFFATFVLGGLTGVMLAVVPFDWQAHDTYFVVAHFHYVLIGGMVFPLIAAIYYWAPFVSGKPLSERMGKWSCALMFAGFHATFFPMHITGMLGMPRRVYTYQAGLGWDGLNLLSTLGAFVLAAGFAVFLLDVLMHLRLAKKVDANVWGASTLEWLPADDYGFRSIPRIDDRDPLWARPTLAAEVDAGQHYLPGTATGRRETLVTSPRDARPQYVLVLTGDSWLPFVAGLGTAAFFLLLTAKLHVAAAIGGVVALAAILRWLWETDPGAIRGPVDIGDGLPLPIYVSGRHSHSAWGMGVLLLVDATIFASLVFSWFYLWTQSQGPWPPAPYALPAGHTSVTVAALWSASGAALVWAGRLLHRRLFTEALLAGAVCAAAATALHWSAYADIDPAAHGYGALVYAGLALQALHVLVAIAMAAYTLARRYSGKLDPVRRVTFDNTCIFWLYTSAQGAALVLVLEAAPRLVT
ncbi:MAG TPA: cytochrome c oxidase subunit I [Burkholderiales bacterium]|nr:cytochrome c oxidase subunit I [Burkholderiales bacterium]